MRDVTTGNFGLLIAYLIPGFVALWGASYLSPTLRIWLGNTTTAAPTVGGFLHSTLAAIAAGVTISTVRWAVVDPIHHATGIAKPSWDFGRLQQQSTAFRMMVADHYNYFKFHANMLVALSFTLVVRTISMGLPSAWSWVTAGIIVINVFMFVGSRNTLRNYYSRVDMVLGPPTKTDATNLSTQTEPPDQPDVSV